MTSTDLVSVKQEMLGPIPDIKDVRTEIDQLVRERDAETLSDVRARAAAAQLYERRKGARLREEAFAKIRLLSEAGLGVISFDQPEMVEGNPGVFRAIASAYERGKLFSDAIPGAKSLASTAVAASCRDLGFASAPARFFDKTAAGSVPWIDARRRAMRDGTPLSDVPADVVASRSREQVRHDRSKQMRQLHAWRKRATDGQKQVRIARAAKSSGSGIDTAYRLLRRTIAAFDREVTEARRRVSECTHDPDCSEMDYRERLTLAACFERALFELYAAEDEIEVALRAGGGL